MDFTLLQHLSASLLQKLENVTEAELLSAFNTLSAIPAHPYDQIKYKYFGPEYKFSTFEDLPEPVNFNPNTTFSELTSIGDMFETTLTQSLTSLPITTNNEIIEWDENLVKKNIIFTEVVNSVKVHQIIANPVGVSQKLLAYYTQLFKN